ncbi:MAG TPA: hypothetical protein VE309_02260 [Caulobacteraceae bacterium]|nr:hypothetical protein [Caulobacteraceae bacterium]
MTHAPLIPSKAGTQVFSTTKPTKPTKGAKGQSRLFLFLVCLVAFVVESAALPLLTRRRIKNRGPRLGGDERFVFEAAA